MKRNVNKYMDRQKFISDHLVYDAKLGEAVWKRIPFRARCKIGAVAGTCAGGYRVLHIQGATLYAHQVVWFLVTGSWPKEEIDHINLNGRDNRIENLREATRAQNARNVVSHKKTADGRLKGAFRHENFGDRWHSQIVVDRKQIYLGSFKSEKEAHAVYCKAARKHHGEFARAA